MNKKQPNSAKIRGPNKPFWIFLNDIPIGSVLTIITERSRYDFRTMSGDDGKVEVLSDRSSFLMERFVFIQGSWIASNRMKIKSFAIGYEIQIRTKQGGTIATTPLLELLVNGHRILPVENTN